MTTNDERSPTAVGRSALAIPVLEFGGLLSRIADAYPDAVRETVPPHVTIAYPFLPAGEIDKTVEAELEELFSAQPATSAQFTDCYVLPGFVYTVPEPDSVVRRCRAAVDRRWPEVQRARRADDVGPHLTLALGDTHDPATVRALSTPFLPLRSRLAEVWLLVDAPDGWTTRRRFPLLAGGRTGPPPNGGGDC